MIANYLLAAFGGFSGGLASFLLALKANRYQNNKYWSKSATEMVGGSITACAVASIVQSPFGIFLVGFAIGTAWAGILQSLRDWITRVVRAILGAGK